jgi:hypothetical protein
MAVAHAKMIRDDDIHVTLTKLIFILHLFLKLHKLSALQPVKIV